MQESAYTKLVPHTFLGIIPWLHVVFVIEIKSSCLLVVFFPLFFAYNTVYDVDSIEQFIYDILFTFTLVGYSDFILA